MNHMIHVSYKGFWRCVFFVHNVNWSYDQFLCCIIFHFILDLTLGSYLPLLCWNYNICYWLFCWWAHGSANKFCCWTQFYAYCICDKINLFLYTENCLHWYKCISYYLPLTRFLKFFNLFSFRCCLMHGYRYLTILNTMNTTQNRTQSIWIFSMYLCWTWISSWVRIHYDESWFNQINYCLNLV